MPSVERFFKSLTYRNKVTKHPTCNALEGNFDDIFWNGTVRTDGSIQFDGVTVAAIRDAVTIGLTGWENDSPDGHLLRGVIKNPDADSSLKKNIGETNAVVLSPQTGLVYAATVHESVFAVTRPVVWPRQTDFREVLSEFKRQLPRSFL